MILNENIHEGDCSVVLCASAPAIRPCVSSPAIARLANSAPVEPTALAFTLMMKTLNSRRAPREVSSFAPTRAIDCYATSSVV